MRQDAQARVIDSLNSAATTLVSPPLQRSPRAVGDAVQLFLSRKLPELLPEGIVRDFKADFSRRSVEDMAFSDAEGNYYALDVKTHNEATRFNMPNLISQRRLADFYRSAKHVFCLLVVSYTVEEGALRFHRCLFHPIEQFSWQCLTIGALGWGQIQIANANSITIDPQLTRAEWMKQLCERATLFYSREMGKLAKRQEWFTQLSNHWHSIE